MLRDQEWNNIITLCIKDELPWYATGAVALPVTPAVMATASDLTSGRLAVWPRARPNIHQ